MANWVKLPDGRLLNLDFVSMIRAVEADQGEPITYNMARGGIPEAGVAAYVPGEGPFMLEFTGSVQVAQTRIDQDWYPPLASTPIDIAPPGV